MNDAGRVWGETYAHLRPSESRERLFKASDSFSSTLACTGFEHGDGGREVVERYLIFASQLDDLAEKIGGLMVGRESDAAFIQRCHKAFQCRADLMEVEIEFLLRGWEPGFYGREFAN